MDVHDKSFLENRSYYGDEDFPRHVILYPDGGRRWAKTQQESGCEDYRACEEDSYLRGAELCYEFLKLAFSKANLDYATVFLLSPTSFEAQRRDEQNLIAVLDAIIALAKMIVNCSPHGINVSTLTLASKPWMYAPERVKNSALLMDRWAHLRSLLSMAQTLNHCASEKRMILLINYSGNDELHAAMERRITQNLVPGVGLVLRTGDGLRISDGPVLGLSKAHFHLIPKMLPDVTPEEMEEAIKRYIPPRKK